MSTYDAILIGAGHNGLTCACYLARSGLRVLVLELHEHVGGMTSSRVMTLPGFTQDVHAAGVQLANLSPSIAELGLAERGFHLLYPPINYAHAFPDGRALEFCRDVEGTCRSLAQYSPRDAETWRSIMVEFEAEKADVARGLCSPPEPAPVTPDQLGTLRAWLDATFESEEVKSAFAAWGLHISAAPDDPGGVAASAFGTVIQSVGNNPVRGGMQHLPDSLARVLGENGGEILCGAAADKILVEDGRAVGVRTADGAEHRATQLVASSVNPVLLARDLLSEEDLGRDVSRRVQAVRHGFAQMTIWLALDGPVEYRAGAFFERSLYVHATPVGVDAHQAMVEQARAGGLPEHPLFVFVNEGGVDPSRVPEGKAAMRILVQPLPYEIDPSVPGPVVGANWSEARETYADYVVELAERSYLPGLSSRIAKRVVHDPVTMSIESPDCVRGDVCHVGVFPDQSGAMRPVPEMGRYRTPVQGLYLCGSGAHPGPGVTLACGYNAAQVILEDLGRPIV